MFKLDVCWSGNGAQVKLAKMSQGTIAPQPMTSLKPFWTFLKTNLSLSEKITQIVQYTCRYKSLVVALLFCIWSSKTSEFHS